MPSSRPGTFNWIADGMAKASEGRSGRVSCREYNVVNLEAFETEEVENRGRKVARIDEIVTCAAAILGRKSPLD